MNSQNLTQNLQSLLLDTLGSLNNLTQPYKEEDLENLAYNLVEALQVVREEQIKQGYGNLS